ncbi:translation factor GTPase family protein [uncultured Draconibacterium sp.]|uniref:elongation factor G n=1 Tax=uncultured Draconibacterium sp. TaxID=1573823 RepID=UPI00263333A2|nr:elongation factor G [uncultured Draconibacterium sp.]
MKVYKTDEVRNIALVGNAGSGKTTLAEAMLFEGGVINRKGDVDSKNTVSDYNPIEQDYGNSVFSTLMHTEYYGKKINIMDTPGMDDLCGGVVSSLSVTALGLLTVNASNGIEAGTEAAARHADHANTPLVVVFNQLDHENSNFDSTLEQCKTSFGNKTTIVQYPVDAGPNFSAIIDVLKMKMYTFKDESGKPEISDIPESEMEKAEELHNELVEKAAENEEALMELYFDKGTLTEDEMRKGIKLGMLDLTLYPVFCTCAKKSIGVGRLMEFITNIAPAPKEKKMTEIVSGKEVKMDASEAPSLFVFKTAVEPHVGEITYFKVMSGVVKEGLDLINSKTGNKERLSQVFVPDGKSREKVEELHAGDLGCTVKLKETRFNQTLAAKELGTEFAPIVFPTPRHTVAAKAVADADDEKVGEVLNKIKYEDPTYVIEYSKELKQQLIHGQGEYHLNVLKWYFDHVHKVDVEYLKPKIPYRETITKPAQADYRHKKQSGGAGQFGEVHMIIEPYEEGAEPKKMFKFGDKEQKISVRAVEEHKLDWGGKLIFVNSIVGGSIDARFLPAILKGIMEKIEEGPLTGSYARDIIVYIYDGKMHPVDSNEISFKLAGRNAFSMAFKNAGPKILEPILNLDVWVPSDRMGDAMSDLQGRRAMIMGMGSEKGMEKITAKVPQKEMYKYTTALSSITGGRGVFSMSFDGYEKVPSDVQEELLKAYEAEQEEE